MKILISSDLYWPVINGVSTFSRNLAHGMAARGHEVLVIAPSQTGKSYVETDGNYKIIRTATVTFPFYQNYKISLNPMREVKQAIDEFKPDIIHIQMLMMIGQAVMHYGHKCNIPIVTTNHAMPENLLDNLRMLAPFSRPINYMLKLYGIRFYSKADFVTMPTQAAIDMFNINDKKRKVPLVPISNGIDLKRFSPTSAPDEIYKKFKIPKSVPVITFVGRVDGEKHVGILVQAFARVLKKTPVHLLIVGDGTDMENVKNLVNELGLAKHTTFTGRVDDDNLPKLHKVCSVFCMPSPAELQSIAMLEAMSSGKPVVAVDAGALKELCQDGCNGYLCAQDDYEAIADGLYKIVSDSKLAKKMSSESLKIAKTHDIETTFDRFEGIYEGLINAKKIL